MIPLEMNLPPDVSASGGFVYAESCAKLPQSVYEGYPPVFAELSAIRFRKIPKTTFDGDFQQRQLDWSGDFAYICR